MEKYICEECGSEFKESELDSEAFKLDEYYCKNCSDNLKEAGWDSVDPNREFDTFTDWSNSGN